MQKPCILIEYNKAGGITSVTPGELRDLKAKFKQIQISGKKDGGELHLVTWRGTEKRKGFAELPPKPKKKATPVSPK